MTFITFIISYAASAVIDAALTWALASSIGLPILIARVLGMLAASLCFIIVQKKFVEADRPVSPVLARIIGIGCIFFGYVLFAFLLANNAMLQWHVVYMASAIPTFALAIFGFWRASTRAGAP